MPAVKRGEAPFLGVLATFCIAVTKLRKESLISAHGLWVQSIRQGWHGGVHGAGRYGRSSQQTEKQRGDSSSISLCIQSVTPPMGRCHEHSRGGLLSSVKNSLKIPSQACLGVCLNVLGVS